MEKEERVDEEEDELKDEQEDEKETAGNRDRKRIWKWTFTDIKGNRMEQRKIKEKRTKS